MNNHYWLEVLRSIEQDHPLGETPESSVAAWGKRWQSLRHRIEMTWTCPRCGEEYDIGVPECLCGGKLPSAYSGYSSSQMNALKQAMLSAGDLPSTHMELHDAVWAAFRLGINYQKTYGGAEADASVQAPVTQPQASILREWNEPS